MAETKVIKAEQKVDSGKDSGASKVQVKAATIPPKKTPAMVGKPVAKSETESRQAAQKRPMGKPIPKGQIVSKAETEAKVAKAMETKAEPPKAEPKNEEPKEAVEKTVAKVETKAEAKAEAPKAEPKKEEAKAEAPKAEKKEVKAEPKKPVSTVKILKTAEQMKAEEEARMKAQAEKLAKSNAEKKNFREGAPSQKKPKTFNKDQGGKSQGGKFDKKDSGESGNKYGRSRQSFSGGEGAGPRSVSGRPSQTRPDKRRANASKDKDKFARYDSGNLEKAAKPKKHSKYKQAQEVVPEVDILEGLPTGTVAVTAPITVAGFCEQLGVSVSVVVMALMKMGIMANVNQNLDEDTIMILADELGVSVVVAKVEETDTEVGIEDFEDSEDDLKGRPPIITVMGHVDHGKTSLLDAIRKTNVTASESGGITQHIGASEVTINGQKIVFLDTPGHEAFTAMRARGAHITDIAVLVVAADDGVMPQTIESISHAKAAGVPIIVAINKIDKPGANPDRVKQELTEHGILVEDWGGNTISVPVSAKTGEGIVNLLEMILLQAEVLELKANPNRLAKGTVIEARLDKNKGPVATLLVTNGTLKSGSSVVAGTTAGHIRLMTNFKGETIKKAGPATAVEILGLTEVPEAGDEFYAVKDDKTAKEIADKRRTKLREEVLAKNASTTLEQLFSQIKEGEVKELNLIIKADVQGSIGAIVASLEKMSNENVRVKIVHTGVGTITESDIMLAGTTGSIIIGFNVRPTTAVTAQAERENIQIRLYRVIYDIINDIEDAMKGMLDPEFVEEVLGKVEVRDTFKVPNVGIIAGAYVQEGKVLRNADIRLVRDGIVIHEGKISSLKRFKDDAKEVQTGYECGIGIEGYNDIKTGDIIECFHMVEVERK